MSRRGSEAREAMGSSEQEASRERRTGALLVVAAAALWSTGGVGVKVADAEPLVIAGLRSAFALAFMLVVIAVQLRGNLAVVGRLLKRPLVWGAAASYALMVVTFVLAARRTTAANAIFIQYTAPIYVALLSGPLLGEKPARSDLFATAGCVVGMALTFGGEIGGGRAAGNLLAILSSFGFAGLPLLLRVDQKRLDPALAARAPLVAMSLGNAIAAAVALPAIIQHPPSGPAQARTLVVLFLLGTLQIGLPYVFYGVAVRRLRALESSLLATIEPVLSPIWVLLATGEQPSVMAAAGCAVIVAAVVFQTAGRRRS
ncbi:MAG: DMT family transporter [Myxococcales bacterium]|nr:DMT family transporter [Myxococcales bacterium]